MRLASAPVIGGGKLFAVGTDGAITAFDAASGARAWASSFEGDRDLRTAVFGGGVSYADGKLYATNGTGDVFALDSATGSQLWKVKVAMVALLSIGATASIGLVQKCGGSGTVLPLHSMTRVRISVIFMEWSWNRRKGF